MISFQFSKGIKFNSHTVHSDCDILEGHLDEDRFITYGIYVKGPKKGQEFMEYYCGWNYNIGSKKRSNSRVYTRPENVPKKYVLAYQTLRSTYERLYKNT